MKNKALNFLMTLALCCLSGQVFAQADPYLWRLQFYDNSILNDSVQQLQFMNDEDCMLFFYATVPSPYAGWHVPDCAKIGAGLSLNRTTNTLSATGPTMSQLNAKMDQPTGTTAQYVRGDGSIAAMPAQAPADWTATTGVTRIANKPTTIAAAGITDAVSATALTSALSGKFNAPLGTTAQYVRGDGSLATLPALSAYNFSLPTSRTIAASTSYQATDPSKAAIIVPSYACQNATTVLAASGCTLQVRMGTGTLTCSTGTVYYTQSLTVGLGLLLTQNSTNPVQINLPIGASFAICPTAGTFTITAVEQSVG